MRRTPVLIALLLATPALAGCSASVPADEIAQQISDEVARQVEQTPDDVTCPEDLPAEVDAEMTCELTDGDNVYDVAVTVTSVDGSDVLFDLVVADEPK